MRARQVARVGLLLGVGIILAGCAVRRSPVVVGALPGGLDAFLAAHPLAPGQPLRADAIGETPASSWHLVQVAGAETPHRHRLHDLAVVILRGEGVLTLDGRAVALRAGDAALVPRDRVHWFARRGAETAVALVLFTPPLDAPDLERVPGVDTMEWHR